MITVLSRIIHYGLKNFWRNGLLSTATVAIMTLSLIVIAGLLLANAATTQMIGFIKDKIDISIYFKTNTPEDEILSMQSSLEKLSEVKAVEYISRDKALELFKEKHAGDDTISQSIAELSENPLQASLNVRANDPGKYATIAQYLEAPSLSQYIGSVSYAKNQVVINRLIAIIDNVNRIGLVLTIFLALIAGLVMFNTIRLAIYSNRDEIGIMRVVGASNVLVRGPYLVQGVLGGALAGVLSIVVILIFFVSVPLLSRESAYFNAVVPGFSLAHYFYTNLLSLLGYQLLFGVGIAVVSSFIAVRRYLKN